MNETAPLAGVGAPDIPGYDLESRMASGITATVYRATSHRTSDWVAIKVFTSTDPNSRRSFQQEIEGTRRLSDHPNVIDVVESGVTLGGRPFIVMPLIAGGSLHDRLRRSEAIGMVQSLHIGVCVGAALETAHRRGLFHCDLKPGNVLLLANGDPVLIDFGAAVSRVSIRTAAADHAGFSVLYAAPEILLGTTATVASDIYSLGATVFALLTGRPAYAEYATDEATQRIIGARVTPDLPPDVPPLLAGAVKRMMQPLPANRYVTAAGAVDDLHRAQSVLGLNPTQAHFGAGSLGPAQLGWSGLTHT